MPTHFKNRTVLATMSLALLPMVSLLGCGSKSDAAPAAPADASSPVDGQVQQVALATQDLNPGNSVRLAPEGDRVDGQVTLDLCGFSYETEEHRTARRQVLISVQQQVVASNEVVAYDSPAQAAKAMTELRTAVNTCPKTGYRESTVEDTPEMRYVSIKQVASSELPVSDNVVITAVTRVKGQTQNVSSVAIFQRRNNVLDAIYLKPTPKLTARDLATAMELAKTTGQKLGASA